MAQKRDVSRIRASRERGPGERFDNDKYTYYIVKIVLESSPLLKYMSERVLFRTIMVCGIFWIYLDGTYQLALGT